MEIKEHKKNTRWYCFICDGSLGKGGYTIKAISKELKTLRTVGLCKDCSNEIKKTEDG